MFVLQNLLHGSERQQRNSNGITPEATNVKDTDVWLEGMSWHVTSVIQINKQADNPVVIKFVSSLYAIFVCS